MTGHRPHTPDRPVRVITRADPPLDIMATAIPIWMICVCQERSP
jgi:hypothetical protein